MQNMSVIDVYGFAQVFEEFPLAFPMQVLRYANGPLSLPLQFTVYDNSPIEYNDPFAYA